MVAYYFNEYHEPIEDVGGIVCNLDFWDCECEEHYIHHFSQDICARCGAEYEDMPPARENELEEYRRKKSLP